MKHFADKKRRDLSTMRAHTIARRINQKSAPRYFWHSKILEQIGPVSYKLKLKKCKRASCFSYLSAEDSSWTLYCCSWISHNNSKWTSGSNWININVTHKTDINVASQNMPLCILNTWNYNLVHFFNNQNMWLKQKGQSPNMTHYRYLWPLPLAPESIRMPCYPSSLFWDNILLFSIVIC
jgi:hypothetical protein